MSRQTEHPGIPRSDHPIEAFLSSVLDELKALADVPTWSLDDAATDRVVQLAARVAAGVAELEARTIRHAGTLDRPGAAQCRGLKQWLQLTTQVTSRSAAAKTRLAAAYDGLEATRAAAARGDVHAEQALAIAGQLDLLDDDVSADDMARAEAFLVAEAADRDADDLARLGQRIYELLDPEGAEAREARALEKQEETARAKTRMTLHDTPDGLTHGSFTIPATYGAMLRKALHALAAPKHVRAEEGAGSYDWQKSTPERLGQAFCDYIGRFPSKALPKIGGLSATVIVVGDADLLEGTVKAARLDTGLRISHTEYLRLACEAGILPMWMNADGEVLSLGRSHRFHNPQQRLAAIATQKHCQHPGCSVPGYLCHLHHPHPWSQGGTTDLTNAELLCPFHHARAHDGPGDYPMRT